MKRISYEDFLKDYKPTRHDFEEDRDYDGLLFLSHGQDRDIVRMTSNSFVWTLVKSENGYLSILSGLHSEGRKGFFITEKPHNNQVEVVLDEGYEDLNEGDIKILESIKNSFFKGNNVVLDKIIRYCAYTNKLKKTISE